MLKTQHPTDYLKKEGVNSEVTDQLKETEQAQRLPKLKRYRRSDSSDDEQVQKNEDLIKVVRSKKSEEDKIKEIEALINSGADVNFKDANRGNNTPLHAAVRKKEREVIKLLLEKGAKADNKNKEGKTPLDLAKDSGNQEIIDILSPNKANLLLQAARDGDLDQVKSLVEEGIYLNVRDDNSNTPLHLAAKEGKLKAVEYLMEQGAQFNVRNYDNKTPLELAKQKDIEDILTATHGLFTTIKDAILNEDQKIEKLQNYIEGKAIINAKNFGNGDTLLHLAAKKGYLKIIGYFTNEKGVSIDIKNQYGDTPLFSAISSGSLDTVKHLIEKGADFKTTKSTNKDGRTPLYSAILINDNLEIVRYLVEQGSNVNVADKDKLTPLHLAAESGSLEVVKYLVEKGADINGVDKNGGTTLHKAAVFGEFDIVKYLVEEKEVEVNTKSKYGRTPLSVPLRGL